MIFALDAIFIMLSIVGEQLSRCASSKVKCPKLRLASWGNQVCQRKGRPVQAATQSSMPMATEGRYESIVTEGLAIYLVE